jgi:hypothetical protein
MLAWADGRSLVKIWITDGSGAPFTDIVPLAARHPGALGGDVPYRGALDAISEGVIIEPGEPVDIVVAAGADVVGRGQLTVSHPRRSAGWPCRPVCRSSVSGNVPGTVRT